LNAYLDAHFKSLSTDFDRLEQCVSAGQSGCSSQLTLGVPADQVFITGYHDPAHDDNGNFCSGFPLSSNAWQWAEQSIVARLNALIAQKAQQFGWNIVAGFNGPPSSDSFLSHGYCAKDTWIRPFNSNPADQPTGSDAVRGSFDIQGDHDGVIHPNYFGHQRIAASYVASITSVLPQLVALPQSTTTVTTPSPSVGAASGCTPPASGPGYVSFTDTYAGSDWCLNVPNAWTPQQNGNAAALVSADQQESLTIASPSYGPTVASPQQAAQDGTQLARDTMALFGPNGNAPPGCGIDPSQQPTLSPTTTTLGANTWTLANPAGTFFCDSPDGSTRTVYTVAVYFAASPVRGPGAPVVTVELAVAAPQDSFAAVFVSIFHTMVASFTYKGQAAATP
jgi:hypothetical protein